MDFDCSFPSSARDNFILISNQNYKWNDGRFCGPPPVCVAITNPTLLSSDETEFNHENSKNSAYLIQVFPEINQWLKEVKKKIQKKDWTST
jgi:hypothetical protein